MSYSLTDVLAITESLWPAEGASSWDASGLVAGDLRAEVSRIHLAVDAVTDTVEEALELGADLLIAHHPLLLRGVTSIAEDRYKGAVLSKLIRGGCSLLAAHTNADVVASGTSATIAKALGLQESRPLEAATSSEVGIGRVGSLPEATTVGRLARALASILPATAGGVRVAGEFDAVVRTVALCAGAGDSLLGIPSVVGADVYITSDLRHHPASEFRENAKLNGGAALIDISHWASEWLWLEVAAEQLRQSLPGISVTVSDLRTDPWDFVVVQ